jgi:hypothetical protein
LCDLERFGFLDQLAGGNREIEVLNVALSISQIPNDFIRQCNLQKQTIAH